MQHLSIEELARLVDEPASHEERLHLDGCGRCGAELEALRAQTVALAELPPLMPSGRGWPLLEAKLRHEGLLRRGSVPASGGMAQLLRAAVYVGLFVAGGVAGLGFARGGATGGEAEVAARTAEEAALRLQQAEAAYLAALSRYGELTGQQRSGDPAARLAALEGIVLTTRSALEAAPADPVINGYYLTAVGQRDMVLRQIAQTSADPWF